MLTVLVPSSSRSTPPPGASFAGAGFVALALLAISSNAVVAAPVQRPKGDERAVASPPVRSAQKVQDLIDEAARRFGVPTSWIAQVMLVESGGHANALSPKGAIGLMQVMPDTYAGLRLRYGLGTDPFNPRDNVLAGAAYLRELYDRYGAPGFLAAYNTGPGRWDDYRLRGRPLASETVAYLARLGPVVGGSMLPMPTFAGSAAIRSPLAAPIFVALSTDPARDQTRADRARIVRVIEANASVVGRADAVFVTRTRTVQQLPGTTSVSGSAALGSSSAGPSADTVAPVSSPSDSLFPARSGAAQHR